jgi:hypothetical protein
VGDTRRRKERTRGVNEDEEKDYQAMLWAVEIKREKETGIETTINHNNHVCTTVAGGHEQANNG